MLIAGTNGKGSTASTLASIANAAGLHTGLYTSPHLLRVNERIGISKADTVGIVRLLEIPDSEFGRVYECVDTAAAGLIEHAELPHYPSYFELMTAIAFTWFAEQRVELAVLEVGLAAGSMRPTPSSPSSASSRISESTTPSISATRIREIAGEKAGILRQDGVLVTLSQHPQANAAIGREVP